MFVIFGRKKSTEYNYWGVPKSERQRKEEFGPDGLGDLDTGFRHSTFYHNYYQGYSEILVDKPGGGQRIERVYTAPYRKHAVSDHRYYQIKTTYAVVMIAGAAAFLWGLLLNLPSNCTNMVALPGMLTALAMFLSLVQMCLYIAAPRKMTLGQFKTGAVRLRRIALVTFIGLVLTVLAKLAVISFFSRECIGEEICSLAAVTAAAAALGFLFYSERKMKYEFVSNDTAVDGERYEIW